MISYEEAQNIIWSMQGVELLAEERVSLTEIAGRVCAKSISAPISVPSFSNSAMDGYAVRSEDLASATEANPVTLKVDRTIAAGKADSDLSLPSGYCAHIMTGAPLPSGANAVVPVERVTVEGEWVSFVASPKRAANIRFLGEDFEQGAAVCQRGDRLRSAHILPLATLGVAELSVFRKPRAIFLSTGKELVDDLADSLQVGQIYNSNTPYALALLDRMGVEVVSSRTIPDELDDFHQFMVEIESLDIDMIISSGAVSAGKFDFVRDGLEAIGAEILYHKMKLRPGKPNLLAQLSSGIVYFGLPGNPAATAVGLRFLVGAMIRRVTGQDRERPKTAIAANPYDKKEGFHMFLKGQLDCKEQGSLLVKILPGQASFMVRPFLEMDAWVALPADLPGVSEGDLLNVYPLEDV